MVSTAVPNNAQGLAAFYNFMFEPQGFELAPHMIAPCYAVMDQRIRNLEIIIGPGSGKSLFFDVTVPAFMIGQDPTLTILGISAGEALIQGFQRAVMEWIEFNPRYQQCFPHIRPDKNAGWSTERGMFVEGHSPGNPDASYFAAGLTSSALTGKHAKFIFCDDIHNKENASSAESCLKVQGDYYKTILGRADPGGCRFMFIGRRWHQQDVYGHIKEMGEHVVMELPAVRKGSNELYWNVTVPDGLECCFTDGSVPGVAVNDEIEEAVA